MVLPFVCKPTSLLFQKNKIRFCLLKCCNGQMLSSWDMTSRLEDVPFCLLPTSKATFSPHPASIQFYSSACSYDYALLYLKMFCFKHYFWDGIMHSAVAVLLDVETE